MTRTTLRVPCHVCECAGQLPDDELPSGFRVCSECMGAGWYDENPAGATCDVDTHKETPAAKDA